MGNDAGDDDDEWDNTKFRKGRVGVWNTQYLRKFTNLLIQNTVLLQSVQQYPKKDPIHELRAKAMEHIQKELGMTNAEQVKQRMLTFRKFAANKLKQCAEKCSPHARPETILKMAPAWLRALEPHLSLWTQIRNARLKNKKAATEKDTTAKPPPAPAPAPASDWPDSKSRGTRLAFMLAQNARELRSLDADVVCKLDCVPAERVEETKTVWRRMLHVVTQKLIFQRDGSDAIPAAKLSLLESVLADLVLLMDPTISTLPESNDYDSVQYLVALFHLAQLHKLETSSPKLGSRWRRAHRAYLTGTPQISGVCSSIIMMQRRWHELKSAARHAMLQYSRQQASPSPIHAAIVKRFPHVVTESLPTWLELVESGQVIEDEQEGNLSPASSNDDADDLESELEGVSLLSPEDLQIYQTYRRSAKEEEDDLVLIEKEIETIDLINVSDERDNELEQREAEKKRVAEELEGELDRQLKDIQKHAGASEKPLEEPTYINDSDSDVECTEDRNRNIDLIAQQIIMEGAKDIVKKEPVDSDEGLDMNIDADDVIEVKLDADYEPDVAFDVDNATDVAVDADDATDVNVETDDVTDVDVDSDDDDCTVIDEKLLMDTRVNLLRVDSTPEWKRVAKRPRVDLTLLDLHRLEVKKPRLDTPLRAESKKEVLHTSTSPVVTVKVEKIKEEPKDDSHKPKGERQVKSMAKRLISEIMREETEELTSERNKVTKKVHLPNIDEVRKNNLSMLTAQVAPLASGAGTKKVAPTSRGGAPITERRPSAESDGELQIDESNMEQVPEDARLSASELQKVLEKLDLERSVAHRSRIGVNAHSAYCCTARRQRSLNAARRRLAARSGRVAPPYMEIHSTSACATKNQCKCCCKHLLDQDERGARLEREALEVDVALRRLLGEDAHDKAGTSNSKSKSGKKKKKTQDEPETEVDLTQSQQNDPLEEWIRQKSLNQKYFNLNLNRPEKPKSQSQNNCTTAPKPQNAEIYTNVVKKAVFRNKLHVLPSEKSGKNLYTVLHSPISSLSPSTSQSPGTSQSEDTTLSGSFSTILCRTPNNSNLQQVSAPDNQKNITLTKLPEGASPKKLIKITLPKNPPVNVINLCKETEDAQRKNIVFSPPQTSGVQTPIGKIITTSDQKKMLVLSTSDNKILTLAAPSLNNLGIATSKASSSWLVTSPNNGNAPRLSTAKGSIVVDSSTNETQDQTAADIHEKEPPYESQGKIISNPTGLNVFTVSSSNLNNPLPKIVTVTSLKGMQKGSITMKALNTLQGKAHTLNQRVAVTSSMPAQITINKGKIVTAHTKLDSSQQYVRLTNNRVRKQKLNLTYSSNKSPVNIAPKPDQEDEDTGGSQDVEQNVRGLRGSGMKVSKISSDGSRSLLHSGDKPDQTVKPGTYIKPGTIIKSGTYIKPGTLIKSGPTVEPGSSNTTETSLPEFKLESHFKRTDYTLPLDKYLLNKDPTNLTVLVFDDQADYLTISSCDDKYLVLSESELTFQSPAYWSLVPAKFSARITFDRKISVKTVAKLNSLNGDVVTAPAKMCLENKTYVKLKDDPLVYAQALFVIRTPAECNSELLRNSNLHMLNTKGTATLVHRSDMFGKNQLALISSNVLAAKALADVLNDLPTILVTPADNNPPPPPPVKSDVNARADVILMVNHVERKAIEMVELESDDEGADKKEFDFKGLENFEDLDDFDL